MQEEYFESIQGKMDLELDGKEQVLSAGDGRIQSYSLSLAQRHNGEIVINVSPSFEKTDSIFELNSGFVENWYKYQDDMVMNGANISLIQLFSVGRLSSSYCYRLGEEKCARYQKFRRLMPGLHTCRFHGELLLARLSCRH